MTLNRAPAEHQFVGDLAVGLPECDQLQDFHLSFGEAAGVLAGCSRL